MLTVNRGFILVRPKQAFCNWAKQHDAGFMFDEDDDLEASVYLIEEDFTEFEPLIERNFKSIFYNECAGVVENDEVIPTPNLELFLEWFDLDFGGCVFDTLKTNLATD